MKKALVMILPILLSLTMFVRTAQAFDETRLVDTTLGPYYGGVPIPPYWMEVSPYPPHNIVRHYESGSWADNDGDGSLSASDHLNMTVHYCTETHMYLIGTCEFHVDAIYLPPPPPEPPPISTMMQITLLSRCLYGIVRDSDGNPIGGATVTCDGWSTTTDNFEGYYKGRYSFSFLTPAIYTVTVSKLGYDSESQVLDASEVGCYERDFSLRALVDSTVDIDPNALNLMSEGNWTTAYIELSGGHDVNDIDVSSIRLNDTFTVDPAAPTQVGDYDSDGVPDLMVKFNRTELTSYIYNVLGIKLGNVTLTVSGQLTDSSLFEGMDTIRVIFAGDVNNDSKVDTFDLYSVGKYYGARIGELGYRPEADLNADGVIDDQDLLIMNTNYGGTTP